MIRSEIYCERGLITGQILLIKGASIIVLTELCAIFHPPSQIQAQNIQIGMNYFNLIDTLTLYDK